MATIVKTKAGTWKALVRRVGQPPAIKTWRLKKDAEAWARQTEDAITRGVYVHQPPSGRQLTLAAALDRYLNEVTPTKRLSTQVTEKRTAQALRFGLGHYALVAVTPKVVAEYRDKRLRTSGRRTGRPLSATTVRLELALLGHLYNTAIREWGVGLTSNPVALIRRPAASAGRTRRLAADEEMRLLAECDKHSNPMLGAIVRLALYTAMRHGEIITLTAEQINLERRVVVLSQTKNGSSRTVPLSTSVVAALREALVNPLRAGSSLLFPGERGRDGQRRPYIMNRQWKIAVAAAGLEDFRFHDLRHEAVSRLVERGLSDQEVAAISGHKSMQMLRRYTHLRAEDLVARLG